MPRARSPPQAEALRDGRTGAISARLPSSTITLSGICSAIRLATLAASSLTPWSRAEPRGPPRPAAPLPDPPVRHLLSDPARHVGCVIADAVEQSGATRPLPTPTDEVEA